MIENLFAEIHDRGWLVSNLFQLEDGTWQANLRTATHHTEWARADSVELALALAIDKMETATETVVETSPEIMKSLDILLNYRRPQQTFRRI